MAVLDSLNRRFARALITVASAGTKNAGQRAMTTGRRGSLQRSRNAEFIRKVTQIMPARREAYV
jgi:hypothetical protein